MAALDHVHPYAPDERACPECGGHEYAIKLREQWLSVTQWVFRSWTGPRRLDGEDFEGPVYYLGSTEVSERR